MALDEPYTTPASIEGAPATDTPADVTAPADDEQKEPGFYCPGCGKRVYYQQQCSGRAEAPHPPIEVVKTDEIGGDNETAAPSTENLG